MLASGCEGSRPRMIGAMAPDFTVQDSDRTVSLHQLLGKPVVLSFWASWCPPCIQEMPSMVQLQNRMGTRVTVLAVSVDEDEQAYHQFLQKYGVSLLTVRDPAQKSNTLYGTTGFPETFIIDAKGRIRRKFVGPTDWTGKDVMNTLNDLLENQNS